MVTKGHFSKMEKMFTLKYKIHVGLTQTNGYTIPLNQGCLPLGDHNWPAETSDSKGEMGFFTLFSHISTRYSEYPCMY